MEMHHCGWRVSQNENMYTKAIIIPIQWVIIPQFKQKWTREESKAQATCLDGTDLTIDIFNMVIRPDCEIDHFARK